MLMLEGSYCRTDLGAVGQAIVIDPQSSPNGQTFGFTAHLWDILAELYLIS